MDAAEFLDKADSLSPALIYFVCPGKPPRARNATFEPVFAQRVVERLVDKYVDPSMKDMCYNAFHADETATEEIISVAQTFPFLAERRVVVVHNAERYLTATGAKGILPYLESPAEQCMLILVSAQLDRRSKVVKICEQNGELIECPELKQREAVAWAMSEVSALGKRIDHAAAEQLVGRAGTSLGDVLNAITLVTNYVDDAEVIREQDIVEACADTAEEEIWTLTDSIAASNTNRAVHSLRALLELGKSEFEILGSINWLLKTAYATTQPKASMAPYLARKVEPLARKLGPAKLRRAFGLCIDADVMFRTTGVDRSLALELLVIKLAAGGKKRRAARA